MSLVTLLVTVSQKLEKRMIRLMGSLGEIFKSFVYLLSRQCTFPSYSIFPFLHFSLYALFFYQSLPPAPNQEGGHQHQRESFISFLWKTFWLYKWIGSISLSIKMMSVSFEIQTMDPKSMITESEVLHYRCGYESCWYPKIPFSILLQH